MKHFLFIISLFFVNTSFSSCNTLEEKDSEELTISEFKTTMHERVHGLTGQQRQDLVMSFYRKVNESANKAEIVPEIRANRYNVAHHYPQTGKGIYADGLKSWCENYPDEVADYILYLKEMLNKN